MFKFGMKNINKVVGGTFAFDAGTIRPPVGGDSPTPPTPIMYTFTINPMPVDAVVIINGVQQTSISGVSGTVAEWSVTKDGFVSQSGVETITENKTINIVLEEEPKYTFSIDAAPEGATVIINGQERSSITDYENTAIFWSVSADHYVSQSGSLTLTEDMSISVSLVKVQYTFSINAVPAEAIITINGVAQASITTDYGTEIVWSVEAEGYIAQSGTYTLTSDYSLDVTLEAVPTPPTPEWEQTADYVADGVSYVNGNSPYEVNYLNDTSFSLVWRNGNNLDFLNQADYFGRFPYTSKAGSGYYIDFKEPITVKNFQAVFVEGVNNKSNCRVYFYDTTGTVIDNLTIPCIYKTDGSEAIPRVTEFSEPLRGISRIYVNLSTTSGWKFCAGIAINKYKPYTVTINPTPSNAVVTINGEERNTFTALNGTEISWKVSADGYSSQFGGFLLEKDETLDISLRELRNFVQEEDFKANNVNYDGTILQGLNDEHFSLLWKNGYNKTWSGNNFTGKKDFASYPYSSNTSGSKKGNLVINFGSPDLVSTVRIIGFGGSGDYNATVTLYVGSSVVATQNVTLKNSYYSSFDNNSLIVLNEPQPIDKIIIKMSTVGSSQTYAYVAVVAINE